MKTDRGVFRPGADCPRRGRPNTAKLELLLTDAVIRYGRDITGMRVDPESIRQQANGPGHQQGKNPQQCGDQADGIGRGTEVKGIQW